LEEAGIDAFDRYVIASEDEQSHGYSEAFGREAMSRLLELEPRPDAVFATSDVQAFGALSALRDAHVRVPDEMAVVGYDDIRISKHIGLTTLRQPMYELGRLAAEKLLARIADPDRVSSHTVFAPHLVARASTLQPAVGATVGEPATLVNLIGASDA
ncbi:MAG: substrate-binding domain-containing protein, partial [Rhodothermales bacterium]|nr:substrate-binding domain-containing protein [Rhodothermales bacterium]